MRMRCCLQSGFKWIERSPSGIFKDKVSQSVFGLVCCGGVKEFGMERKRETK